MLLARQGSLPLTTRDETRGPDWGALIAQHERRVLLVLLARGVRVDRARDITQQLALASAELDRCSAKARAVFDLVYAEEALSHAEGAARLGLSVQRFRQTLCEVRARRRAVLAEPAVDVSSSSASEVSNDRASVRHHPRGARDRRARRRRGRRALLSLRCVRRAARARGSPGARARRAPRPPARVDASSATGPPPRAHRARGRCRDAPLRQAPPAPAPEVRPEPVAAGHAPPPDADAVLRTLQPRLRRCWETTLVAGTSLEGSAVLRAEIASDGTVQSTSIDSVASVAPGVTSCLLAVVRGARFAGTGDPRSFAVRFSFVHRP